MSVKIKQNLINLFNIKKYLTSISSYSSASYRPVYVKKPDIPSNQFISAAMTNPRALQPLEICRIYSCIQSNHLNLLVEDRLSL